MLALRWAAVMAVVAFAAGPGLFTGEKGKVVIGLPR